VKPAAAAHSFIASRSAARKPAPRAQRPPRRECIALSDATDCLLEAYDVVARQAYENFLNRGAGPDGELQDWFSAERELLLSFPIHVEDSEGFVYAMASIAGATAAQLSVGVESRWLVILAHHREDGRTVKSVCILELPASVDASRSIAVLSDGILGIRMPKTAEAGNSKIDIRK
jgi:HSP20 family molecular chaperone IbpA